MNILKNRLKIKICLALLVALIFSSCSTEESSKGNSSIEQSGVFSEVTENSEDVNSSKSEENSESVNSSNDGENSEGVNSSNSEENSEGVNSSNDGENSEGVNSSNSGENSEDVNSSNDGENSEDGNSSNSGENSADVNSSNSEESSEDVTSESSLDSEDVEKSEDSPGEPVSKDYNSSEDTSEESGDSKDTSDQTSEESSDSSESKSEAENDSSDDYLIFDIPEEYENLNSYKALETLGEEISDAVYIEMHTKTKYMNQDIDMTIKSWESSKTDAILTQVIYERGGSVIFSQKELMVDGVKYIIDDKQKTYCVVPESEYLDIDELLEKGSIESVETKNELVGLEICVADWFTLSDGSRVGFYTKDGDLKYIGMSKTFFGQTTELVFKTTIRNDNSEIVFSIPKDYALVEYKN